MSKTVDTDPMTPLARQLRTQPLRGRVDTQPLPMRVDTDAAGAAAGSAKASPPGSDAKLPIAVPSAGAGEEEPPPSSRAPSSQRFDTQPFPLQAEPTCTPERADTPANDSDPSLSSRTEVGPQLEARSETPQPLGAEAPLRKEDLPALFASIAHTMREPNARIDAPPSEEVRYIAPRPLRAKNKTPSREQRVVVRRSVMEPVVVPPRSSEAAGTAGSARAEDALPPTRQNVQTVLTTRVTRRRLALPGVLTAAAVAIVGAGVLILALRRPVESPPQVTSASAPAVSSGVPSVARVEPTNTAQPSAVLPPAADVAAPMASASHEDVPQASAPRLESPPSRVARPTPAVPLIASSVTPPVVPTESNHLRTKSVQPAASSAPSAAAAKPVPHADILGQERSE